MKLKADWQRIGRISNIKMAIFPTVIWIQYYSWENFNFLLGMVMPPYNPSVHEAEAKGSQVQS